MKQTTIPPKAGASMAGISKGRASLDTERCSTRLSVLALALCAAAIGCDETATEPTEPAVESPIVIRQTANGPLSMRSPTAVRRSLTVRPQVQNHVRGQDWRVSDDGALLATTIPGGDFGGGDLTPGDGDTLSGAYLNVGTFFVASGVTAVVVKPFLLVDAESIRIEGAIDATGAGEPGGVTPAGEGAPGVSGTGLGGGEGGRFGPEIHSPGGGGAGYGGVGGSGGETFPGGPPAAAGGSTYLDLPTDPTAVGSGGGSAANHSGEFLFGGSENTGGPGGAGGGHIVLKATTVTIDGGSLIASGANGESGTVADISNEPSVSGGGGGSGGGIRVEGNLFFTNATFTASGGNGGDVTGILGISTGGGGGGGGRVRLLGKRDPASTFTVNVDGGAPGSDVGSLFVSEPPSAGSPGTPQDFSTVDIAPTVTIDPTTVEVAVGVPVPFTATPADDDDDLGDLTLEWSVDGVVQAGEIGTTFTASFTADAVVRVTVTDPFGLSAFAEATVDVVIPGAPSVTIDPATIEVDAGVDVPFTATPTDDEDPLASLTLAWSVDGVVQPLETATTFTTSFTADAVVRVTVTDPGGLSGFAEAQVTIAIGGVLGSTRVDRARVKVRKKSKSKSGADNDEFYLRGMLDGDGFAAISGGSAVTIVFGTCTAPPDPGGPCPGAVRQVIPAADFDLKGKQGDKLKFKASGGSGGITDVEIRDDGRFKVNAKKVDLTDVVDLDDPAERSVQFAIEFGGDGEGAELLFDEKGRYRFGPELLGAVQDIIEIVEQDLTGISDRDRDKLLKELEKAVGYLDKGNTKNAAKRLESFVEKVKKLIEEDPSFDDQGVIDEAESLIDFINNP